MAALLTRAQQVLIEITTRHDFNDLFSDLSKIVRKRVPAKITTDSPGKRLY